ncbi:ECM5 [Candida jiufengensis]|uniref:ECM5 n=1 Tax=Candida jiufengensis TaxID=497108 RepID=UPI00222594D9|nr:ECM5 [Candida jiufengensis]KAI5953426.1 ECM5 [Candida jiufengensis]
MSFYSNENSSNNNLNYAIQFNSNTTTSNELSSFPKTSRFFDNSSLPDLKQFEIGDQKQQIWFNGQLSNFNYSPFNILQQKLKASPSLNYDLIPNKFFILQPINQEPNEIPFLHLNEELMKDPMLLIENLSEIGKKYGAIKIKLPNKDQSIFQNSNQVNSDLFWFETNKLLNNPKEDEIYVRLNFHRNLLDFHQSDLYKKFEDSDIKKSKDNFNFHLNKLPMIDKRPLDLYKLFQSVMIRGGFSEVINKKLWAQIGRELGYKGKIMTSLSSSLKSSYHKILYPYELYLASERTNEVQEEEVSELSNGKRNIQPSEPNKKMKKENECPLIIGSAKQFKRRIKTKVSKGFIPNAPHLIDIKQPNTFIIKQEERKRNRRTNDTVYAPITPQSQFNHSLSYILNNQDESPSMSSPKIASVYTLRQFMEKDLKFQEYIIQENKSLFQRDSAERDWINFADLETLYWKYIKNEDSESLFKNGYELEMGKDLPSYIHGSGFVKIGDDIINFKNSLNNYQLGLSHLKQSVNNNKNGSAPNSAQNSQNPREINSTDSINQLIHAALYPWNLHNLPTLPNSILGALSESDISNRESTTTRINVGMTFSTENWSCEDHFTQLINYHFFGASKRWYFIPESEFEKFESLIKKVNAENQSRASNLNNQKPTDTQRLMQILFRPNEEEIETDVIAKSLENVINTKQDIRLSGLSNFKYNQEFMITPELLEQHNINYTTTVQNPGEFIIKFPKTYSSSKSYGFNFCEEVNFASSVWLDYALEGEKWLQKQGILPNFSTFKLLSSLAIMYDTGKSISFSSDVFAKVAKLYESIYLREVELRNEVRKYKLKETTINEESSADIIADDDLSTVFPTRILVIDKKNKSKIISLETFLDTSKNDPTFLESYQCELQLFYSDEKLKNFYKILNEYSVDFESWIKAYEELMSDSDSELSLKQYKVLLNDGDKINLSIMSTNSTINEFDQERLNLFRSYLDNLRYFTTTSTQFIEDCQNLLSIKHQQRIRNGQDSTISASFNDLMQLVSKIPKLNFTCPEIDQILEFKVETENFDKASRALISKRNKSLQEFDNLISLGESFGLDIPSLSFITRIRDRLLWLKTFELIEKGVDPYSDKKEVFTIDHLKKFYYEGLEILSEDDLNYIKSVEKILNESIVFNYNVGKFLTYRYVHDLNLQEMETIVDKFTQEKLFISMDNYTELSKIQFNLKLITQYNEKIDSKKTPYPELKTFYNSVLESGLNFNTTKFSSMLQATETWIELTIPKFEKLKILTTMKNPDIDHLNQKYTTNSKLIERLYRIFYKIEYNLSKDDKYEECSSFLNITDNNEVDAKYYCICREFEHGTMVECDKCNEWYHVQCVKSISNPNEDKYNCPTCLLIGKGLVKDQYLNTQMTFEEFAEVNQESSDLEAVPVNEAGILQEIFSMLNTYKIEFDEVFTSIMNEEDAKIRLDKLKFHLRKIYGCGIFMKDICEKLIQAINDLENSKVKNENAVKIEGVAEKPASVQDLNTKSLDFSLSINNTSQPDTANVHPSSTTFIMEPTSNMIPNGTADNDQQRTGDETEVETDIEVEERNDQDEKINPPTSTFVTSAIKSPTATNQSPQQSKDKLNFIFYTPKKKNSTATNSPKDKATPKISPTSDNINGQSLDEIKKKAEEVSEKLEAVVHSKEDVEMKDVEYPIADQNSDTETKDVKDAAIEQDKDTEMKSINDDNKNQVFVTPASNEKTENGHMPEVEISNGEFGEKTLAITQETNKEKKSISENRDFSENPGIDSNNLIDIVDNKEEATKEEINGTNSILDSTSEAINEVEKEDKMEVDEEDSDIKQKNENNEVSQNLSTDFETTNLQKGESSKIEKEKAPEESKEIELSMEPQVLAVPVEPSKSEHSADNSVGNEHLGESKSVAEPIEKESRSSKKFEDEIGEKTETKQIKEAPLKVKPETIPTKESKFEQLDNENAVPENINKEASTSEISVATAADKEVLNEPSAVEEPIIEESRKEELPKVESTNELPLNFVSEVQEPAVIEISERETKVVTLKVGEIKDEKKEEIQAREYSTFNNVSTIVSNSPKEKNTATIVENSNLEEPHVIHDGNNINSPNNDHNDGNDDNDEYEPRSKIVKLILSPARAKILATKTQDINDASPSASNGNENGTRSNGVRDTNAKLKKQEDHHKNEYFITLNYKQNSA